MSGKYDGNKVHLSLAGSGDPWSSLTRLRKRILRELHYLSNISSLESLLEMSHDSLMAEIQPMIETSLVFEVDDTMKPSFLVTDESETNMVYNHARAFSRKLADIIEENIEDIKASYEDLEISIEYDFDKVALFFVGGRILDIKLFEKLSRNNRVMPPAPARPSPTRPDAYYYFFMVEGDPVQLGAYGQDDTNMPWPNWYFITFGQNIINGQANSERKEMDDRYSALIVSGKIDAAEEIAEELGIPFVGPSDSAKWEVFSDKIAEQLCKCYEENEKDIKALHSELAAGKYAPHSLGEFFCWYAHIAYACAIELLEEREVIKIPSSRFQAAIWYREREREGLLFEL